MVWWNRWRRRLRMIFRREQVDAEMADEMRFHMEMEASELSRTEGLDPAEAKRRALVTFGGVEEAKERARDVRRLRWLEDLAQDTRHGVRTMRRAPGFTAVAVVTLALGIGATTAMFSVVHGVMLTPLPYPESDRLVAVWSRFLPESGFDFPQFQLSPPEYFDYRHESDALADVAAYYTYGATLLQDDGVAISVRGAAATANLLDVLRVGPALGRTYSVDEDVPSGPSLVVLGHGLWRRAYGADPAVVGRTIRVNGRPAAVIGVMPEGFAYPTNETALWTPLGLDPAQSTNRAAHFLGAVGRLADGADLARARAEMDVLMARWKAEYPKVHTGHFLFLRRLIDDVVGSARPALVTLLGAVAFVLLIVCANVANLLLARGEVRQRELAVRSALGAGRARLIRQFLAEGAVLSLTGGLAGLALAYVALDVTLALGADWIPRAGDVAIDRRALFFTGIVTIFTTIVFTVAPAMRLAIVEPRRALSDDGGSTTSGSRGLRIRHALVAVQVALAVVVVIGAGLMVRSFAELTAMDPGFRAERVLVADLSLPSGDYPAASHVIAAYERIVARLGGLPGARAAAAVSVLPLGGDAPNIDFRIEGAPSPAPGEPAQSGDLVIAGPGYADTMGVGVVEGRFFRSDDREGSEPVAVVNRRLARMFWPGESAVGRRIRIAGDADVPWLTIVGVIDDVQFRTLADEVRPAWYLPLSQMPLSLGAPARSFSVALRTAGDPSALARLMRAIVRDVDPTLPVIRLRPLEQVVAASVARPRFTMTVLTLFAALALLLGAVGIYGVLAYAVVRRTRELAIRIALGAGWRELAAIVLAQGARFVLAGLIAGLAAAAAATRLIQGLLFLVTPTDPATFAIVAAIVFAVAFAASMVPVRRALRADPIQVLRAE